MSILGPMTPKGMKFVGNYDCRIAADCWYIAGTVSVRVSHLLSQSFALLPTQKQALTCLLGREGKGKISNAPCQIPTRKFNEETSKKLGVHFCFHSFFAHYWSFCSSV
uniref:Uncharacterized protein n=1 Tax=Micrurus carvalhoi TaxID=3147026 RepID=A0A2H6N1F7_9SAUR